MRGENYVAGQQPEEESSVIRSKFDSILGVLRKNRPESDDSTEDDDESYIGVRRKKAKSSKWRKFMRKMFSKGSAGEEQDNNDSENNRVTGFRALISFEPVKEADTQAGIMRDSLSQEASLDSSKLGDEQIAPTKESVEATNNEAVQQVPSPEEKETPSKEPDPVVSSELSQVNNQAEDLEELEPSKEAVIHEMSQPQVASEEEKEHTHETRPNPVSALLALDYLNHRGRKRLEKDVNIKYSDQEAKLADIKEQLSSKIAQTEEKIRAAEESITATKTEATKPKPENKTNAPQLDRSVTVNTPVRSENILPRAERTPTPKEYVHKKEAQEQISPSPEVYAPKVDKDAVIKQKARQEQLERLKEMQEQDKQELKKHAFERDIRSIEDRSKVIDKKTYKESDIEKKHEILDNGSRQSDPHHIGAIIQQMPPPGSILTDSELSNTSYQANAQSAQNNEQLPKSQISNAAKTGFYTALVIIVLVSLIAVLQ